MSEEKGTEEEREGGQAGIKKRVGVKGGVTEGMIDERDEEKAW